MNDEKIFLQNLKNWMIENKKTQTEVAELAGFHHTYISQMLLEKQKLTWNFVLAIRNVTKKSLAELFTPLDKQFSFKGNGDAVEDSNKDAIIKLLQAQLKEAKNAQPTPSNADSKVRLVIEKDNSVLFANGMKIEVEDLDVTDIFKRKVMLEMSVDEIVSK